MARIPADHLAFLESPLDEEKTTTSRVLKSQSVRVGSDEILIPLPTLVLPIVEAEPVPEVETPEVQESESLNEAIETAERNYERRLAAAIEEAKVEAHAAGFAEGQAAASSGLAEKEASLNEAIAGLRGAWDSFAERSEPLIAELGFRLAEAILGSPLPDRVRAVSTTALSDAIERIGGEDAIQVTVHPADFMALTESGLVAQIGKNHAGLAWRTDAGLERGDWEARSNAAIIRRVALEMLADARDRLGHADSTDDAPTD